MLLDDYNNLSRNGNGKIRLYHKNKIKRLYLNDKELVNKKINIDDNYNIIIDEKNGVKVNNQMFISLNKIDDYRWEELVKNIDKMVIVK